MSGMARRISEKDARRLKLGAAFGAAFFVQWLTRQMWPPWATWFLHHLPPGVVPPLRAAFGMTLYMATLVVVLSAVGRALGARKGSWALAARAYPTLVTKVLPYLPGAAWFLFGGVWMVRWSLASLVTLQANAWVYGQELGVVLGALGMTALARAAIRSATSAVHEEASTAEPVDPGETIFRALAVTWATRSAVAAVGVLPFLFLWGAISLKLSNLQGAAALVTYIATAFGSVVLLRRVSRIKVGIDGVYVMGSGPAQFTAWTDVDTVRAEGPDIVVARGKRELLRLQLHGDDAKRRDALVARFEAAMDAAARTRTDASHVHAAHAAEAATGAGAARFLAASHGAGDYRAAAVNREQLWEVVEGAAAEPSVRVLAAETLAMGLEGDERARLRVAAEHCAEPKVRVALEELLEEAEPAPAATRELPRVPT